MFSQDTYSRHAHLALLIRLQDVAAAHVVTRVVHVHVDVAIDDDVARCAVAAVHAVLIVLGDMEPVSE